MLIRKIYGKDLVEFHKKINTMMEKTVACVSASLRAGLARSEGVYYLLTCDPTKTTDGAVDGCHSLGRWRLSRKTALLSKRLFS